jgi:ATP-binding cassette, subfamily B, multidrug efflux pump
MSHPRQYIDEDKIKSLMTLRQLFWRLWPYMARYRSSVYLIVVMVLTFTALGRVMPFLFGYAVDNGIAGKDMSIVIKVAIAYFFCEMTRVILGLTHTYRMERLGNRVLFDLRETLINHVQRLPTQYFDRNPTGRIVTRVTNDVLSLGDLFNQGFTAIFVCTLEMVAIGVAMLMLSPVLTAWTLALAPIAAYLSIKVSQRARFYFSETKKKMAQQNAFTAESLNGMKVLQLFAQTHTRQGRFGELSNDYKEMQLNTVKQFALLWPIIGFFNVVTVASALLFCSLYQDRLALTIGQITTFLLLVQSFYQPIRTLLERYNQFQNSLAGADRIFTLLSEPAESEAGQTISVADIEFKNLSFRYSPQDQYALADVNMKIEQGQSVALVGRTGSGKSTFISLLQKLYPIHEGSIEISGVSLHDISILSLRRQLGVVQQDPFIFKGTLLSNITLHDESISEERAKIALLRVGGGKILNRSDVGMNMRIEERGSNLSVGEKQILSFARVLAHDPKILILDEATANVDSESEKIIQSATDEVMKNRTCIVVAHRLSTIVKCDKIVVLDKSRIVEVGRHEELLARDGLYAKYYNAGLALNDASV